MKSIFSVTSLLPALVIACLQMAPIQAQARLRPVLAIKPSQAAGKLPGDKVSLSQSTGLATINVCHVRGIGACRLTLIKGDWPAKIKLVLQRFPYLENLTISGGAVKVSFEEKSIVGKVKKSKRIFYVPAKVMASAGRDIDVSWVDAYR